MVGPLAEGQLVTINACLNGTSQCVSYSALGARPEYAILHAISGTTQSLSAEEAPEAILLRLLDMDGNPMAGPTVTLYEALYDWAPSCGKHSVCASGGLLAAETATATSGLDGTLMFTPASLPGVTTDLAGLAVSDNTSTIAIAISQHP
jgi:hypothetical protein